MTLRLHSMIMPGPEEDGVRGTGGQVDGEFELPCVERGRGNGVADQ